jgi:hypothetical protein
MAKGERKGGGAKMTAARPGGTVGKPRGLKPGAVKVKAGAGGVVINRTRAEAASAQRKRSRATVEATRGQVIGAARGVTATAGGGEKVRVRRSSVSQGNLLGGSDVVRKTVAGRIAANKGPAPGSRSARSAAGKALRSRETTGQRLSRVSQRVGVNDIRKGPAARRAAMKGYGAKTQKKIEQSSKTEARATRYVIRQKERMRG